MNAVNVGAQNKPGIACHAVGAHSTAKRPRLHTKTTTIPPEADQECTRSRPPFCAKPTAKVETVRSALKTKGCLICRSAPF